MFPHWVATDSLRCAAMFHSSERRAGDAIVAHNPSTALRTTLFRLENSLLTIKTCHGPGASRRFGAYDEQPGIVRIRRIETAGAKVGAVILPGSSVSVRGGSGRDRRFAAH